MYFMIMFGVLVCSIFLVSVCRCTVSNAFDMSRAIAIVLVGGFFLVETASDDVIYAM